MVKPYSTGLRREELLDLKIEGINRKRMPITVCQGKGKKDRMTLVSKKLQGDLRGYYKAYSPKKHLFEGESGNQYTIFGVTINCG